MRVRFAPSPTGYFHVGGARTAFYNWMLAKKAQGSFVLRIEDTDVERNREEWVDGICNALSWLGITWDEGPYRQSERLELYSEAAKRLFEADAAYFCVCIRDEIDARNKANGSKPGYDRHCRDLGHGPNSGGALRFKVPIPGSTSFTDLVRGEVTFENENLEDFILVKSSGAALFVLANVVDDIDMSITHVIRAEEHLPNTPKAVLLFEALGAVIPNFGHVPVLVNEKRQKLSKRRDKVAVEDYRNAGYLAPAMLNYLALLGWSPKDDREFMTVDEMTQAFEMANVGHSPSFFDEKKLAYFNGVYIRALSDQDFVAYCLPFLDRFTFWSATSEQFEALARLSPLVKERVTLLSEVGELLRPIFETDLTMDANVVDREIVNNPVAAQILILVRDRLLDLEDFESKTLEQLLRLIAEETQIPLRKLQTPLRVATTGSKVGLPLFETWAELGPKRTIERISRFC